MSKKGGSFISLPTIIAAVVAWNVFFGDDDDEDVKQKVDTPQDKPAISLEVSDDLKETGKELLNVAKKAALQIKQEYIDNQKAEEATEPEKPKEPEDTEVVVIVEKTEETNIVEKALEPKVEDDSDSLKPLDDAPKEESTFKSL